MDDVTNPSNDKQVINDSEDTEDPIELVLFHVPECYVYIIPPRKTAASYRFQITMDVTLTWLMITHQPDPHGLPIESVTIEVTRLHVEAVADEWDVNKWAWEGVLKVVSKGEECIIRLEDKSTGELYARAFLRKGEQHPVEPVIDSSRYFVLRVEENIDGRLRHAFIGIGFRERTEAYDFQAALHDHMKYLDKKKTAEEMEQQFQNSSTVDYSLKDGETLVLQLKNKPGGEKKSKPIEQGVNNLTITDKSKPKEPLLSIKPPPPPPTTLSPSSSPKAPKSPNSSRNGNHEEEREDSCKEQSQPDLKLKEDQNSEDDDFGDFQAAG